MGLGLAACAACAGVGSRTDTATAPVPFYTVTAELALARNEPRVAARQYAAAAEHDSDVGLLQRATQVATDALQPSLVEKIAVRWTDVDPKSVDAQRAAAQAALALYHIDQATAHYRAVLLNSPVGTDAEFAALETFLAGSDNIFGAHALADRLASSFPSSGAALRMQGFAALRADDPEAAVHSLTAALAIPAAGDHEADSSARRELQETLARARILAGDVDKPLAQAQEAVDHNATADNRLDLALLLMTAQRASAAYPVCTWNVPAIARLLTQRSARCRPPCPAVSASRSTPTTRLFSVAPTNWPACCWGCSNDTAAQRRYASGCGMSEATMARVFEPFFTTRPPGEGTGLGLSVVHGIITQHGGRVALESREERGTRFDIYLPALAAEVAARFAETQHADS